MLHLVLITGISGSGKTVALRMLEDAAFACVDNLPVQMLASFLQVMRSEQQEKVAVSIDVRTRGLGTNLPELVEAERRLGTDVRILFLDASTHILVQRFSETRRRHPLSHSPPYQEESTHDLGAQGHEPTLARSGVMHALEESIALERDLLASMRSLGHVIDTSGLTTSQLRHWVRDMVELEQTPVILTFESFAFKHGVPRDADLVFDVRCLPNPYYDLTLRPLTGRDVAVADFLGGIPDTQDMINDIASFVLRWLPRYQQDSRSYLTVAIGCTGGQHRSVYCAEKLAERLRQHSPVLLRHRRLDE